MPLRETFSHIFYATFFKTNNEMTYINFLFPTISRNRDILYDS